MVVDGELTEPKVPLIPGHEIVGTRRCPGDRSREVHRGPAGRHSLARVQLRRLPILSRGSRKPVPPGALYRLSAGRRLRRVHGGRPALLLSHFRGLFRRRGGTADVCRTDRPPLPAHGRRCRADRALRLRRRRPHRCPGCPFRGAAGLRLHPSRRYRGRAIRPWSRRGLGRGRPTEPPPELLDAAIIFAPVGSLVPLALRAVRPGGRVVCAGIYMSEIPAFPYEILWEEREIVSVANLTRRDGEEFLALAPRVPVRTTVQPYPLAEANEALANLRDGRVQGAAVLMTGALSKGVQTISRSSGLDAVPVLGIDDVAQDAAELAPLFGPRRLIGVGQCGCPAARSGGPPVHGPSRSDGGAACGRRRRPTPGLRNPRGEAGGAPETGFAW